MPETSTEETAHATTLVICLGNEDRGDDGFGPRVARRLGNTPGTGVRVIEHHGDAIALIDRWSGFDRVILIDAIVTDRKPGTILHFDLSEEPAPFELNAGSTHALGAGGAIELARALGKLPRRIDVLAVAADRFEVGEPLGEDVASQVDPVADAVTAMIR